jgi:RHS repeat-associated protein
MGVHRALVRNPDETYTATDKAQTEWRFDAGGRLTQVRDRNGNASNLSYETSGLLSTISDPAGRGSLSLGYTDGRLTSVSDWAVPARSVTYQYDGSGRLWKVTDRESQTTTFTYDGSSHRLATITDPRGNVAVTTTYDAQGRVATQKDARGLITGDVTTFDYVVNPDGSRETTLTLPSTSFEPLFHPTLTDAYDSNGWLIERTTAPSSSETIVESFTYDSSGNRTSHTDPRGNRTDFCHDVDFTGAPIAGGAANLTRVIQPPPIAGANRPVSLIAYDAKNNVIQTVAPKGVPSGQIVSCTSDLSAVGSAYVADYAYDATGANLLSTTTRFTDPDLGLQMAITKYEYDDPAHPGLVTRVIPPRGNTGPSPDYTYATTMTYYATGSMAGQLKDMTDPLGNKASYAYDPVGRVTGVVDALGNAAGGVPADHTTSYTYDKEDRVRFVTLPAPVVGQPALVSETRYNEIGKPIASMDANGQVTTFVYDERNSLFQVNESPNIWADPASPPSGVITTEYGHDAGGNITRITRAKGDGSYERATDYTFDGRGLAREERQYPAWPSTSAQLVASQTYDPAGNVATSTDPLGQTKTFGYDALNRLTSIDYSSAGTADVSYAYDAHGNRTSMTDGTGVTSYAYDETERLISVTSPGPKSVGYRYDLDGNRTKLIYPDGTAVTYTFNKGSQLASLQDWGSRSVTYTYWPDGLVKTATNPDASVATYDYDNSRRLVDVSHARAGTGISEHAYQLDAVGNVASTAETVSGITGPAGWEASSVVNPPGGSHHWPAAVLASDETAHAIWERPGTVGDLWYASRNPVTGVWTAVETPHNVVTLNQVDPDIGIDAAGNVYAVWVDYRNGVSDPDIYAAKRSASTGTWSTSVRVNDDPAGKLQQQPSLAVRSNGEAVVIWRDERGNKKHIYSSRLAAGGSTWSANMKVSSDQNAAKQSPAIAYGPTGIAYAVWHDARSGGTDVYLASLASGGSSWSSNTIASDGPGTTGQYNPDIGIGSSGDLLVVWTDSRTTPTQLRSRRRVGTTWQASIVVASNNADYGALSVRADGNAVVVYEDRSVPLVTKVFGATYTSSSGTWSSTEQVSDIANDAGRPAVAYSTTQWLAFWDTNNQTPQDIRMRRKPLNVPGIDNFAYTYDRLYRLTGVTRPDGPRSYTYDPAGNRLTKTAGPTTAYTYDRADRMLTAGSSSVTVNANGNITSRGSDTFGFNQANRLTTAAVAGSSESYTYDGDGTRFTRQVGVNPPTRYVSDVAGGLPATIDDGTRKYVYGLGLAYAVTGSSIEVYHADRLGSVRALTNEAGTVTASYRSDEWGLTTATSGSSAQPFGYTGEPRDATGLTYLRARYYDPSLGRFMSRDTWTGSMATSTTQNRYVYANNNPGTLTDPSGHCVVDTFVDVGFLIFDIAMLATGSEKDRELNSLALAADAAMLLVPCAAGAGAVIRFGDEAAQYGGDALRWLDEGAGAACSFTPQTLVATRDGRVPISSIEVGDIVLAWDQASGAIVERSVTAVLPHLDDEIARVTIDGQIITTTPDHPFYTIEAGWVEAGLLWPGAHVQTTAGSGVVASVAPESFQGTLWDLTVDGAHTFFVGQGEALVHNCPADEIADAAANASDAINRGGLNTLSERGARDIVGDPHAFKAEYVGSAGSRFNIAIDKSTNQIVLVSHDGTQLVPTGVFKP